LTEIPFGFIIHTTKGEVMTVVAKMNNRLVEVVKVADTVAFSSERGWVMVCFDWEQPERKKQQFKWVPASTRFEWVRRFDF
jgi:hypothetical protein